MLKQLQGKQQKGISHDWIKNVTHKKLHRQKGQILPLKWQKNKTEQKQSWQMIKCTAISIKVHIFWEGHTILRNLHLTFVLCSAVKSKVKILQNFGAFPEYMNFKIRYS